MVLLFLTGFAADMMGLTIVIAAVPVGVAVVNALGFGGGGVVASTTFADAKVRPDQE
jgi:hypothetical protein